MAQRTFVFCDRCNPCAVRFVDRRSCRQRDNQRDGRRVIDGRAWFEGTVEDAIATSGWVCTDDNQHLCAICYKLSKTE